jgi:micrococcal nuclease
MFKRLLLSASIGAALLASTAQAEPESSGDIRAAVTSVIDGDSFIIEPSGIPMQVDLETSDAPEMLQPFGPEAKRHLESLILGKDVVISQSRTLEYRHITGVVTQESIDINRKMIAEGFAWADDHYSYSTDLKSVQAKAKKSKSGLWSQKNPQNPASYRMGPQRVYKMPEISVSYPEETATDSNAAPAAPGLPKPAATGLSTPPPPPLPPSKPIKASNGGSGGNQKVFLNAEKIQQAREQNLKAGK